MCTCGCVGHANNVHCLAKAVNALAGALFTVHGPGDVEMRLKEFLAVSDTVHHSSSRITMTWKLNHFTYQSRVCTVVHYAVLEPIS